MWPNKETGVDDVIAGAAYSASRIARFVPTALTRTLWETIEIRISA